MAMSQTMDKTDQTLVTPAEIQWRPAPAVLLAGAQGVGAHLHRREGRPAPEAEVTLEE